MIQDHNCMKIFIGASVTPTAIICLAPWRPHTLDSWIGNKNPLSIWRNFSFSWTLVALKMIAIQQPAQ